MLGRNLHKNQQHTVGIDDVHFVQPPWFLAGLASNLDATALQLGLGGGHVADLKPQRARKRAGELFRSAMAGQFDQRLAGVEDGARAVVAEDRQTDLIPVEAQRPLVVHRPEQHPAGENLHAVVSITRWARSDCPTPPHRPPRWGYPHLIALRALHRHWAEAAGVGSPWWQIRGEPYRWPARRSPSAARSGPGGCAPRRSSSP